MDKLLIQKWVEIARWAPSGGNVQPWNIIAQAGTHQQLILRVDKSYAAHPSLLDLDGSAVIIAFGTFVESLSVAAEVDGYHIEKIKLNNSESFFHCTVEITFKINSMASVKALEILGAQKIANIKSRHTNRNLYQKKAIPESFIDWIKEQSSSLNLRFTPIDQERPKLIKYLSLFEKVRWEDPHLLHSLLEEITLKSESSMTGIPVTNLGAGFDGQMLISLLKNHPSLRRLLSFGLSNVISQISIKRPITRAGHFIFLSAEKNNFESYFNLGRLIQRTWLSAHENGLAMQPFCGHLLAYHWLRGNSKSPLSKKHVNLVVEAQQKILQTWKIDIADPLFGFRLGYPIKQGEISPRKPIMVEVQDDIRKPIAL